MTAPLVRAASSQTVDRGLLRVRDLSISASGSGGLQPLVSHVSFAIREGSVLGLIGESGSGKSMIAKAILGMLPEGVDVQSGEIDFCGSSLRGGSEVDWRKLRGSEIGAIFQDPLSSLNPVMRVGDQVREAIAAHSRGRKYVAKHAVELLERVGIPDPAVRIHQYPHEFSGGMRQRVCIAMAIANRPKLLVADEPTTAVDVTVQAKILRMLSDLRREMGLSILLITHDMGVVSEFCEDVIVMQNGRIVEAGAVEDVLSAPRHDYTRRLVGAVPRLDAPVREWRSGGKAVSVLDLRSVVTLVGSPTGVFRRKPAAAAVDRINLEIRAGETLGLVGESGCGKTTLARTAAGFLVPSSGEVVVGQAEIHQSVQYVFQDPFASLDPQMTIQQSLDEALQFAGVKRNDRRCRSEDLMRLVGLDPEMLSRRPTAFSGGQRQRIVIARALAAEPEVLVCDEAVSALDVSIQSQVLKVLEHLQEKTNVGILFISHDLAVVKSVSHRVAVMYLGRIVEIGPTEAIYLTPRHPYTAALLSSVPSSREHHGEPLELLGETPRPGLGPSGCRFRDRCPLGPLVNADRQRCIESEPELSEVGHGHSVACHYPGDFTALFRAAASSEAPSFADNPR